MNPIGIEEISVNDLAGIMGSSTKKCEDAVKD